LTLTTIISKLTLCEIKLKILILMFINLNTKIMKRLFLIMLSGLFCLAVYGQTTDSTLIEELKALKKEVVKLQKSSNNHNALLSKLRKTHQDDLKGVEADMNENSEKIAGIDSKQNELEVTLNEHMKSSGERIDTLSKWTKQMVMIQFILFGVLFIVLLILVITNRQKIKNEFIKLEAKVDNVKNNLDIELKQLQKKHEEDLATLKKDLEEKK